MALGSGLRSAVAHDLLRYGVRAAATARADPTQSRRWRESEVSTGTKAPGHARVKRHWRSTRRVTRPARASACRCRELAGVLIAGRHRRPKARRRQAAARTMARLVASASAARVPGKKRGGEPMERRHFYRMALGLVVAASASPPARGEPLETVRVGVNVEARGQARPCRLKQRSAAATRARASGLTLRGTASRFRARAGICPPSRNACDGLAAVAPPS
jgi:hypothetical protein